MAPGAEGLEASLDRQLGYSRLFRRPKDRPRLDHFLIIRKLGRGGMGAVYEAFDPELDRPVAIKVLNALIHGDIRCRNALVDEARAMAKLSHPNVVQVHEVREVHEQLFIVMEYVPGQTLRGWLDEKIRDWREITNVWRWAGAGLAAAHESGLVHRDFKPENVLLGADGRARVADFGLAQLRDGELSPGQRMSTAGAGPRITSARQGTPAYMSPEQHRGAATDPRSDQFSFCASLHEALSRLRMPDDQTLAELVLADAPVPAPRGRAPAYLWSVLRRGLACAPDDRWPTMGDLLVALEDATHRRRRQVLLGAALVAATAISALIYRPEGPDLCSEVDSELLGVWDTETRMELRSAFVANALADGETSAATATTGFGEGTWQRVAAMLDVHVARWLAARRDSCRRTRDDPAGVREQRRAMCLAERRAELLAFIDEMRVGDPASTSRAVEAAASLTPVSECDAEAPILTTQSRAIVHELWKAKYSRRPGHLASAARIADELEDAAERDGDDALLGEVLLLKGTLLVDRGKFRDAEGVLSSALWSAQARGEDRLAAELALARMEILGGKLVHIARAQEWLPHAEALVLRAGDRKAHRSRLWRITAEMKTHRGEYDEAARLLRSILAESAGSADESATERLSVSLLLADVLRRMPRVEAQWEALAVVESAHMLWLAVYGEEHNGVAQIHVLRAQVVANIPYWNRWFGEDMVQKQLQRALHIARSGGEEPLHVVGAVFNDLGNHTPCGYTRDGQCEQRLAYFERARDAWEAAYGPQHPKVAIALANAGLTLRDMGRLDLAVERVQDAVEIIEATSGQGHPAHTFWLGRLGGLLVRAGRVEEGTRVLERALAAMIERDGEMNLRTGEVLPALGRAYLMSGAAKRAEEVCLRGARIARSLDEPAGFLEYSPLLCLGRSRLAQGQTDAGLGDLRTALKHIDDNLSVCRGQFCFAREEVSVALATALWAAGSRARSLATLCEVEEIYPAEVVPGISGLVEVEARMQGQDGLWRRVQELGVNLCGPRVQRARVDG